MDVPRDGEENCLQGSGAGCELARIQSWQQKRKRRSRRSGCVELGGKRSGAAANWVSSLKGTRVYDKELTKKLGGMGKKGSGGRIGVGSNTRPEALECHLGEHHRKLKQGRACPQCSVDQGKFYGRAP